MTIVSGLCSIVTPCKLAIGVSFGHVQVAIKNSLVSAPGAGADRCFNQLIEGQVGDRTVHEIAHRTDRAEVDVRSHVDHCKTGGSRTGGRRIMRGYDAA